MLRSVAQVRGLTGRSRPLDRPAVLSSWISERWSSSSAGSERGGGGSPPRITPENVKDYLVQAPPEPKGLAYEHPLAKLKMELTQELEQVDEQARKRLEMTPPPRPTLDEDGWAWGAGKRKTCRAVVKVRSGHGRFIINRKNAVDYLPNMKHRHIVSQPLGAIQQYQGFDVEATIRGGGFSGGAQAIRLALARALTRYNPAFKSAFEEVTVEYRQGLNMLQTDPRVCETKKAGLKKARKSGAWVKR